MKPGLGDDDVRTNVADFAWFPIPAGNGHSFALLSSFSKIFARALEMCTYSAAVYV